MSRNAEVAALLNQISEILEIQQVPFKPRAYQRAALNVETLGEDIARVMEEGRLAEVPGVGKAIAEKITEYLTTGRLPYLEELKKKFPDGLLQLLSLPGVGPKRAMRLFSELKIDGVEALKKACQEHRLRDLKGFGEKSEEDLLKAIERASARSERFPLRVGIEIAEELAKVLASRSGPKRVAFAGSFRRGRDTIGDLDVLVEAKESEAARVTEAFVKYSRVRDVAEKGTTRSRVVLQNGLQVDLRVVPKESFGAAMLYFTGSKDHNIALRTLALKKRLTLNEYALARVQGGKRVAGETEEEVYAALGLAWIPPEIRENRRELDLAAARKLPTLVEEKDLRGDLHTHTSESDGYHSAKEMLEAAMELGHEYLGISDHSQTLAIARGLDRKRFEAQRKSFESLRESHPKIVLLQGSEVDILKDGALDLDAKTRAGLDFVVGAVHSAFNLGRKEQTQRVIRALEAGVDVLAHPTGRREHRESYDIDLEAVAEVAAERGVAFEINASLLRLDLWGDVIRPLKERGARFCINSDAHTASGLDVLKYGITQARRGWLEPRDVINTFKVADLRKTLGHAKRA